jgi:riboflavin kinase/FMN adenylyltransferase
MAVLTGFDSPARYRNGYVSIGNFDGVHCGHQSMLKSLVQRARSDKAPAVVLTFDPHPIELLRPESAPPRLTTMEHRAELLKQYGADCVIILPTTRQFLSLTAEEFFQSIVLTELQARGLVEGPNFYFGRNRSGSITLLKAFCASHHLSLDVIPAVTVNEQLVSSSVIRSLIIAGDLADSVHLLGHPYRLTGTVGHGAERGRQIGFPTANLVDCMNLIPGEGVYAAKTTIDGIEFAAAVNVGPNPTFAEAAKKVEVHVLGFTGNLYGKLLGVDFLEKIRDVRRFASVEELIEQLRKDAKEVESIINAAKNAPRSVGL